jgi:hypothetical protein
VRAAARLDPNIGLRLSAIPVRFLNDGGLLVAVADPTSEALAEVQAAITGSVAFAVTELADIQQAWRMIMLGRQP